MLTHDWGPDELGRNNHDRVVKAAMGLKRRGVPLWIDEFEMTGNIIDKMCQAINDSHCVAAFITKRYVSKVDLGGGERAWKKRLSDFEMLIFIVSL